MRALAQPLLFTSLTLAVTAVHGAASGAESSPVGEPIMRTRVEPAPQAERMAALALRLSPETEAVWLETNSDRTLTLYYPAVQPEPHGALVLLPDEHRHPDWPTDLHPLRIGLAQHGWDTLAISLPQAPAPRVPPRTLFASASMAASSAEPSPPDRPLDNGTPMETYGERVDKICEAALRHLESRQRTYLILLGSGSGAAWAAQCAERFQQGRDLGLVLLDARRSDTPGAPDLATLLPQLKMPVLDLYRPPLGGAEPGPEAQRRARTASRAALADYHQSPLPAWNPDGDWLLREVRGRIERYLMPPEPPKTTEPEATADQRPGG